MTTTVIDRGNAATNFLSVFVNVIVKCNQYYSTAVHFINYMYSNILSWNIIEKKTSGHVGTRTCVASISGQQTCYIL